MNDFSVLDLLNSSIKFLNLETISGISLSVIGFLFLKLLDNSFVNVKDCMEIFPHIPVIVFVKYYITKLNFKSKK